MLENFHASDFKRQTALACHVTHILQKYIVGESSWVDVLVRLYSKHAGAPGIQTLQSKNTLSECQLQRRPTQEYLRKRGSLYFFCN